MQTETTGKMPKSNINVLKATGKNLFNPALTPHYTFISSGLTGLHDIGYVTSPISASEAVT